MSNLGFLVISWRTPGLDIKHLVYMPIGHVILKVFVPCKNFDVPSQYLYKPCKAYVYCWKNKYMPWLKNHLPSRARNHKCLCALGKDLHAPGTRARLNVEPWTHWWNGLIFCMLMYPDHLQNLLDNDHIWLIFLILTPFSLSEMGQIWVSWQFGGALWIFLIMVPLWLKLVIFGVSWHYLENVWE